MSIAKRFNLGGRGGGDDRMSLRPAPWTWRDDDGLYIGANKEGWLYRKLSLTPLMWEDAHRRMEAQAPLASLLYALAETSRGVSELGIKALTRNREIHLLAVTWDAIPEPPKNTPAELDQWLRDWMLQFTAPDKALFIGVQLWPSVSAAAQRAGTMAAIREKVATMLSEDVPDPGIFEADRRAVFEILRRHGAGAKIADAERAQLESWFNGGRGPAATVLETRDQLYVGDTDRIEMAAVQEFKRVQLHAASDQWALAAATHPASAAIISIRGEITPSQVARNQVRRASRKALDQIAQDEATGDVTRLEHSENFAAAQALEEFIFTGEEPLLTNCSIIFGRRVGPETPDTYIDLLRSAFGIEAVPLEHRQLPALAETLPTASERMNPFVQAVSVGMLAYAGLAGFTRIGDTVGAYLGLGDPDMVPVWIDPLGAPANNLPPGMLVTGEPGAGKAVTLDTPVLTPTGWVPMGDLVVGDRVIGRDGTPTTVTGVFPQGERDVYRVRLSDGTHTVCDADHLWAVRKPGTEEWRTMTAAELVEAGGQWDIPTMDAAHFDGPSVGDGYAEGVRVATSGCCIDEMWLRAPVDERLALLQGVCDTIGKVAPASGGIIITPPTEAQTATLVELTQLLGGIAQVGTNGHVAVILPAGTEALDPSGVTASALAVADRLLPARAIVGLEPAGHAETQCIAVDADDHLYVIEHGIVTHNTFLIQNLALQFAIGGLPVIFVNPKADDDLSGLAELSGGRVVNITEVADGGGFFDPFRFCSRPDIAAGIAVSHINQVLGSRGVAGQGFTQEEEIALSAGIRQGAEAGARCVADALRYVNNPRVRQLVLDQAADPLFRLGIGMAPAEPYFNGNQLLLIQFDKPLDLPPSGLEPSQYTREQRIAVAALRLTSRAALEMLAGGNGGVMIIDEAWSYLQSSDGLQAIQSLGRLGRSQNILPIFATQRLDDLLRQGIDMQSYISRAVIMKTTDPREQLAAMQIIGSEPTPDRLAFLASCGPRQASEDGTPPLPARGLFRDLLGRHAAVHFGPAPEELRLALSTNPQDRRRRRDALGGR